ncbi:MAG TPA: molybdenum cofactor guanylyltransferase [Candidatus Deferrimicrobiaceae bacterium]|nr:molybdenum cofactor guanylyltransferase [Candidatus Deferrimicrobiaceae bacterium]
MTKRAAIILAGGRGSRFQTRNGVWQDKGLAFLEGKPLLVHVIENIQQESDETLVVVKEKQRKLVYNELLEKHGISNVKIVTDVKSKTSGGPLIAILTGLKAAKSDICLTVPSDMPLLNPKVAEYMFKELDGSFVAVPMWPDGKLETLLMALHRKNCLKIAEALCQLRRERPDDIIRGALKDLFVAPLGKIKKIDPGLKSFININYQQDLTKLIPRQSQGTNGEDLRLNLGEFPEREIEQISALAKLENAKFPETSKILVDTVEVLEKKSLFFWAAIGWEYEGKFLLTRQRIEKDTIIAKEAKDAFLKAAENYAAESEIYRQNRCFRLAERSKSDQEWCETQAKNITG